MATTRTAYDAVAGTVLTATNLDRYPGGWVGEASATSTQTSAGVGVEDLTGLSITFTAVAGRRYKISAIAAFTASVNDGAMALILTDGSNTQLQASTAPVVSATLSQPLDLFHTEVPGAGSITRKLRMQKPSGTGTLQLQAAASRPALLLIEDVGPG